MYHYADIEEFDMNKFKMPQKNPSKHHADIISKWVNNNIETFDVAIVVDDRKYEDRLVSVLPLAVNEDSDGTLTYPAVISDCPVILQGNLDGFLHFPLTVGCKVLIGYPKESIEEFIYGSITDQYVPVDGLKFNNSQAVVLGAVGQVGQDYILSKTDFELKYFDASIRMTEASGIYIENKAVFIEAQNDGTVKITNSGGGEWLMASGGMIFANGCITDTDGNVTTANGTNLDQLKADFDSLVNAYVAHGAGAPAHPPPNPL